MKLLVDYSGKLLKSQCLDWLPCRTQAIAAAVRGSDPKRRRASAHVLAAAVRKFMQDTDQLPRGVSAHCEAVMRWSVRVGQALRKLVGVLGKMFLDYIRPTLYRI